MVRRRKPPSQGVNKCDKGYIAPGSGVTYGFSGTLGRLLEYSDLTLAFLALREWTAFSLATREDKIKKKKRQWVVWWIIGCIARVGHKPQIGVEKVYGNRDGENRTWKEPDQEIKGHTKEKARFLQHEEKPQIEVEKGYGNQDAENRTWKNLIEESKDILKTRQDFCNTKRNICFPIWKGLE